MNDNHLSELHFERELTAPNIRTAFSLLQVDLDKLTSEMPDGLTARAQYWFGSVAPAKHDSPTGRYDFKFAVRIELTGKVEA